MDAVEDNEEEGEDEGSLRENYLRMRERGGRLDG
jgi:hypothetical protein